MDVSSKLRIFFLFFISIFILTPSAFSASYTTYQAKIVKPDGYPLEASNVNFKFTILNPAGTCIMYAETYSSVNMTNTGGIISFSLGSGVKTYPVSSPTFFDIFSNAIANHACDTGGPASYTPSSDDTRKIVMQFHDGGGWQTLPAMTINAVPYAMYANDSQKLGGVSATSYVRHSTIPTCTASQALQYTGASFNCVALPEVGSFSAGDVVTALSYTPANATSVTLLNNEIGNVSSTVYAVSSTVNSLTSNFSSLQNSVAVSLAAITSSQWVSSGTTIIYNTGNVVVSGGVRISMDSASCSAANAGSLRYNAGAVEYCNGTTWTAFGVSGAGLQGLNGSVSGTQSFAIGTAGTSPGFVTNSGVHTLNIPLASAGSVTAGLLSNADYSTFMNKITSSAASIAQVLGYTPASATALANYLLRSGNLSDLTSSATARTNLGVGYIGTLASVDLGSADVSGTLTFARTPAFIGDVTKAVASNTLVLSNSGVTAGTYTKLTVDAKGRVTSSSALSSSDVTTALGFTPSAATSGVTSLNGSTSQTQTFAIGTAGNNPAFSTANGVHTLSIPLASTGSVTAGLLSNTDYTTFMGKITSSAASIAQVLGYVPASATALGNYLVKANNLSDLTSSATARTNLGVGYIGTLGSVDLSSADVSGTLPFARTPAFIGDVTKAAASNTLILSNSGVTAGTYTKVTVDAKGRVTSSSVLSTSDVTSALGYTPASATASTQWTTSGTGIFYNTGNVGIGTTSPATTLDVSGTLSINDGINKANSIIPNVSVNGGARTMRFNNATSNVNEGFQFYNSNASTSLMMIQQNGNVGIGTTSPAAQLHLRNGVVASSAGQEIFRISSDMNALVVGSGPRINFENSSGNTLAASVRAYTFGGALTGLGFDTGYGNLTTKMVIDNAGNVGVGTTAPTAKLQIAAGTSAIAPLKFTSGTLLTSPQSGTMEYDGSQFYLTDSTNTRRAIATGSSAGSIDNASTINSTGNITMVPVGSVVVSSTTTSTNSSTGALVVKGGLGVAGNIFASGTIITSSNIQGASITATNGMIAPFIAGSIASSGNLTLDSTTHASKGTIALAPNGGSVGVGILSPTEKLHVAGNGLFRSNSTVLKVQESNHAVGSAQIQVGQSDWYGFLNYDTATDVFTIDTALNGVTTGAGGIHIKHTSGNVGIGTSAPTEALQVEGAVRADSYLNTNNEILEINAGTTISDSTNPALELRTTAAVSDAGAVRLTMGETAQSFISFGKEVGGAAKSDYLFINNTGNVGIGTVTPGSLLEVANGDIRIATSGKGIGITPNSLTAPRDIIWDSTGTLIRDTGYVDFIADSNGDASGGFRFYASGTTRASASPLVSISMSGNVGIGTTAPAYPLHVSGAVRVYGNIYGGGNSAGTPSGETNGMWVYGPSYLNFGMYYTEGNPDKISISPNGGGTSVPVMVINGSGNIGIGTSTPTAALNIVGTGGGNDDVHIDSYSDSAESTVMIRRARGTVALPTALDSGDRIGFYTFRGYDGSSFLDVARIQSTTESDFGVTSASANIQFFTNYNGSNTEKMRISASGAVGVGTTTPTAGYRMDVFGDMYVGNGGAAQTIRFRTANTDGGFIRFNSTSDAANGSSLEIGTTDNLDEPITFTQSGQERMRIHTNNYVGIGTSTPTTHLAVNSNNPTGYTIISNKNAAAGGQEWRWYSSSTGAPLGADSMCFGLGACYFSLYATGNATLAGTLTQSSDVRLKRDISSIPYALDAVTKLEGVTYYWKDSTKESAKQIGLIAQDVEKVFPEAVKTNALGFKSVAYQNLVAPIINALREIREWMFKTDERVQALEKDNAKIKAENQLLKEYLCEKDPAAKICQ